MIVLIYLLPMIEVYAQRFNPSLNYKMLQFLNFQASTISGSICSRYRYLERVADQGATMDGIDLLLLCLIDSHFMWYLAPALVTGFRLLGQVTSGEISPRLVRQINL